MQYPEASSNFDILNNGMFDVVPYKMTRANGKHVLTKSSDYQVTKCSNEELSNYVEDVNRFKHSICLKNRGQAKIKSNIMSDDYQEIFIAVTACRDEPPKRARILREESEYAKFQRKRHLNTDTSSTSAPSNSNTTVTNPPPTSTSNKVKCDKIDETLLRKLASYPWFAISRYSSVSTEIFYDESKR